jgi:hypothetical protein
MLDRGCRSVWVFQRLGDTGTFVPLGWVAKPFANFQLNLPVPQPAGTDLC